MNLYSSATVLALVIFVSEAYPSYKLLVLHFGNHLLVVFFFFFIKCFVQSFFWEMEFAVISYIQKCCAYQFINCVNFPCSFAFHIHKVQVAWTKIAVSLFLKITFEAHLICYRIKFLSKSEICSKNTKHHYSKPKLSSI